MVEIEVFPGKEQLIQAAAEEFVRVAETAVGKRGGFSVALSGGSTPRPLYAMLGGNAFASRVDWAHVHLFWGDERCVPPEDTRSNYRMVRETLLQSVPLPPDQVHRIRGEDDPSSAASEYEHELRTFFGIRDGGVRISFDLVLLGIGEDGHTASLFPGSSVITEPTRWVCAEHASGAAMWRITQTPIVINAAKNVIFLVSGPEKAGAVRDVLQGPFQPERLPAQAIKPLKGRLTWLLDKPAAGLLEGAAPVSLIK
jgi:6-phosphogluconolactonase